MKIAVTGSTGFVGRHLLPKLFNYNHVVLELTIEPETSEKMYGKRTEKHIITENQSSLFEAMETFRPEIIIHLASYLTSSDDYQTMEKLINTNILFLCRVLDSTKNIGLKLFINTGTFAEYSRGDKTYDPAYLYAATKTASRTFLDYYSKVYHYKQTTVVPFTIYGGIDSQKKIIDLVYDSLYSDIAIDLSPGEQVLDYIHINDVTDFYIKIIENHQKLPVKTNFQLGTGIGTNLKQLATFFEEVTKKKQR